MGRILVLLQKIVWRLQNAVFTVVDAALLTAIPVRPLHLRQRPDEKVLLFLGDSLQPRLPRMAKWIARLGNYRCVLLVSRGKDFDVFNTGHFDLVLSYRSRPHLRRILRSLKDVFVIHGFSIPSYPTHIALQETDVAVVADFQDMYVSYFGLDSPMRYMRVDMPHERACVEGADGLVSESMELAQATRTYAIKRRPPTLFFPVYCDEDNFAPVSDSILPNEPHLVYAGSVAGSFQDDRHFGSMKLHGLIPLLASQRIHFHLYPSPSMRFGELILAEYRSLANSTRYFHLHDPVTQDALGAELAKYDFGIIPFFLEDTGRGPDKLGRGSSQKLFNYLEAGLPVIISEDLAFQAWMAQRYGAAIPIRKSDLSQLRSLIESSNYEQMKRRLYATRTRISLGTNIPRLLDFYERVSTSRSNN